jgi:hypothetical protein
MNLEPRTMVITTPVAVYNIDLTEKIGQFNQYSAAEEEPDLASDTKSVRKETYLGKPCEVRNIMDSAEIWVWEKIILRKKTEVIIQGMSSDEYAVDIDEAYEIKPDEFTVPKDIKISGAGKNR